MSNILSLITAISTALIAGLFYSYTCSVNIGLGRLPDRDYITAMQAINSAILNPMFFMSFIATLLLLPLSAYLEYRLSLSVRFWLLFIASAIYLIGVFGVTVIYNLPLNEALANFQVSSASDSEIANQRLLFEKPWLFFHAIRTIGSITSLVLLLISLLYKFENS